MLHYVATSPLVKQKAAGAVSSLPRILWHLDTENALAGRVGSNAGFIKAMLRKRADWSRALPQPLIIPGVMTLVTPADVRELMRHLPEDRRSRPMRRQVAADIEGAAAGGDIEGAAIGLRMALFLERVEFHPQ